MNEATTSPIQAYTKQIVDTMLNSFAEGTLWAYRMLWDALLTFLAENWLITLLFLFFVLVAAIVRYLTTGRWKTLGSVLYTYFYFGIMFLIGLIGGPDVYASDYFPIVGLVVYIISFSIVGFILISTGIRRPYR